MSVLTGTFDRLFGMFGYVRAKAADIIKWENRSSLYTVNGLLYDGWIYRTRSNGGDLEGVLKDAIGPLYCDVNKYAIGPHFLPFRAIVDTYQNVLPGTFGHEIKPAEEFAGKPINASLPDALGRIWRASNLDTEKAVLFRYAANFGTVGIRITARGKVEDKPPKIMLGVDHPSRLFNFEEDSEGNVTAVCLKYTKTVNVGTLAEPEWQPVDVVEEITREDFSLTFDGAQQLDDGVRRNDLGFCPYVILRHKTNSESPFGDWAYKGSEAPVHRINWRISRQDRSIDRHQFPKWFGAGAGDKPQTVDMGDTAMTWVKLAPDSPTPLLQAIVPQVDQAEARAFWQDLRDLLRNQQPEMNLNDVKLLGNISGEALAQVLKPTAQAVESVKPNYHHALIRALQMAVSAGIVVGAWDLGTGTGTSDSSDRAYRDGLENFEFSPTPPIPQTVFDQIQQAKADNADKGAKVDLMSKASTVTSLSGKEVLRQGGYSEGEVAKIMRERQAEDEAVTALDGTDTVTGGGL